MYVQLIFLKNELCDFFRKLRVRVNRALKVYVWIHGGVGNHCFYIYFCKIALNRSFQQTRLSIWSCDMNRKKYS